YLIVNHITGKYYVGQHKGPNLKQYLQNKLSQAWYELKRGKGGSYLFRSMRKHPKEAWSIHALLSDIQTRPELDAYERDFISFLRSQDPEYGYNICRGGEGFTGPHTKEAKEKISCASRKRGSRPPLYVGPRTDEWKKTMSLIMKKKGHKPFPNKGARNGSYRRDIHGDEIAALYASGLSTDVIAAKLKASSATIWSRLKKQGVVLRRMRKQKVSEFPSQNSLTSGIM